MEAFISTLRHPSLPGALHLYLEAFVFTCRLYLYLETSIFTFMPQQLRESLHNFRFFLHNYLEASTSTWRPSSLPVGLYLYLEAYISTWRPSSLPLLRLYL